MKSPKLILTLAIAALAFVHVASAQVAIYISGAPATRKIWNEGLLSTLKTLTTLSGSSTANIVQNWTTNSAGTSYDNANQIALSGGAISGTAVTIYTSWLGSTEGNQAVAAVVQQAAYKIGFIAPSFLTQTSGTVVSSSTSGNLQYPQFNLSDTYQSSLPFNGTTRVSGSAVTYDQLSEGTDPTPAVTGFEFLANKNAPADLTNLSSDVAQVLFTTVGGTPLALLTGSSGDKEINIYPVGRDIGSGARYIFLAESGVGTANNTDLIQYTPAITTGTITNIASNLSASGTINQIAFSQGNGGYSSTSSEESTLEASSSTSAVGYVIGYLTDSDAATVLAANPGQSALTWNGVPYSITGIQQGQYTYWSFLHVYYDNTNNYIQNNYPLAKKLADQLSIDLTTDPNTGAIFTSTLQVSRSNNGDGGTITPNY